MVRKTEGYSLLLLAVVIIFLNILAIIVILRFKKKYNPDILILSLAIADLVKALVPLNMTLYAYLSEKGMTEGSVSCVIFGWTAFTLNCGIMMVMTVMAIDRYIALCWPFEYKRLLSKKRLIYTIVAVFVFSGTQSVLPLVGIGKMRAYNNGSFCHFDFDSTKPANRAYSIFVLSLGMVMIVVVVFCYTRAMISIKGLMRRQRRMSICTGDPDGADRNRQAMNSMFARLMIVMMMVFFVSWLLFLIVILQHVSGWFQIPPQAHFWSMRLAVINSVLNPLIGAAMCKPYREGYIFILCKIFHCCGLCSSYKADNPWTRRLSLGSRRSFDVEPTTPTTDQTVVRVTSNPSFSYHDSGIVPDGGSIGYHQGGLIYSAYEKEPCETESFYRTTVDGVQERPRLHKKRISFKDQAEANEAALPSSKEKEEAGSKVRLSAGKTTPKQETSDLPSSDKYGCYTQENGDENKIIVSPEMDAAFEDESSCGDTRSGSSKRKRKIAVSVYPFMCKTPELFNDNSLENSQLSRDSQGDNGENVKQNFAVTEKAKQDVKPSKADVLTDCNQLSLSAIDVTSEPLSKDFEGENALELSPEAKSTEKRADCFSSPGPLEETGSQTLQVTHFPVNTNSGIKTTVLPDSFTSRSSLPFSRSRSFIERTFATSFSRIKLRSRSFANGSTSNANPFYEFDNLGYQTADLPFHRHSVDLAGEQLGGIQSYSESDFTFSLPETVLVSPHGTPNTESFRSFHAVEHHNPPNKSGISVENENRPQGQSSNHDVMRKSSKTYKELSELSLEELDREVFC